MWLPDWLYERLPMLYGVAGAMCLVLARNSGVAVLSAALMFAASYLIANKRRRSRMARQAERARAAHQHRRQAESRRRVNSMLA
jgi:hypothetical protein